VERSKIVTLHEEGYSERQISEKLKFSKTAIHQPVVKFKTYASFQDLSGGGRPKVTRKRWSHDKEDGSMLTHHFKQKDSIQFVAHRGGCQYAYRKTSFQSWIWAKNL